MVQIIKGMDVIQPIKQVIIQSIENGIKPCLGIIRIGNRSSEISYEKSVIKQLQPLGIVVESIVLPEDVTQEMFDQTFDDVNQNSSINGILLLKPLPQHLSIDYVEKNIDPLKDVDCIGNVNMSKLYKDGKKGFLPCTAEAVLEILEHINFDLVGKKVALVGFGMVIGRPAAHLLVERGATVTICHKDTKDLVKECIDADLIIVATGVIGLISSQHVKPGAVIVDVGINVDENGKLCGDVCYDAVQSVAGYITPVPGGVGTVTTYTLAKHTLNACIMQK
ncbi:bifunctional 5,10-methylenetetrahydrofolate dehydrogenase/5,10-methenyltetrahydrofolate cyclohydrolase [Macrococcus sp. DPC7161]|uniref:bifunctional 5,10-methylenetetrahydrofolate dehydrogenase/5,10-methenyltetrahydrofolate cyclohydrolase n=1 Tax=Macrococcus sp. DPC7161 TaxID=2507060 RepID=UPI0013E948AF|nr:bifunctional 5,10-methylenetetrahydrofolate dehydrogenase/5,10-methenyltetrahydrofolate cyclohydrolase [Macrococcus sp. DPC7161]